MKIVEIENVKSSHFQGLIDLMHQQMLDIGSKQDRMFIEAAVRNALKPESRAHFFLAQHNEMPIGVVFMNICSGVGLVASGQSGFQTAQAGCYSVFIVVGDTV